LDKRQVRLVVLHAIDALRVGRAKLEVVVIGQDAVLFQHLGDDLGHGHLLENPLIDPMGQVRQMRAQRKVITGQAPAGRCCRPARECRCPTGKSVKMPACAAAFRGQGRPAPENLRPPRASVKWG